MTPALLLHLALSLAVLAPAAASPAGNQVGQNWPNAYKDWSSARMYADLARTAREIRDHATNTVLVPVDALGAPLVPDFRVWVSHGLGRLDGTYRMRIGGKVASVSFASSGTITPTNAAGDAVASWAAAYDGKFTYGKAVWGDRIGNTMLTVVITGAHRDAAGTQPGIRSLELMRPLAPGASASYPFGALFTKEAIAYARRFDVIRYMGFTGTNFGQQRDWTDSCDPRRLTLRGNHLSTGRPYQEALPLRFGTRDHGDRGGPWEDVIRFSNAAGRDAWINVPTFASDDYVHDLARLFRYGSDGVTPYTSRQANPVFPPLDPGLKLYVEWSNELWNWGFSQASGLKDLTAAQPAGSPIHYDGAKTQLEARYAALRSAEISLIFRQVFGDGQMMTRVRPIFAGQAAAPTGYQGVLDGLGFAFDCLADGAGRRTPGASWRIPGTSLPVGPHPPSYYWYGAGGAAYYVPDDVQTVAAALSSDEFDTASWERRTLRDMRYPALFGVRRVAYEGGPNYGDWGWRSTTTYSAGQVTKSGATSYRSLRDRNRDHPVADGAWWQDTGRAGAEAMSSARYTGRPSTPNMTDVMLQHHDHWSRQGGGLLVYLGVEDKWEYGGWLGRGPAGTHGGDILAVDGIPQMVAAAELRARPPAAVRAGQAIPGSLDGNDYVAEARTTRGGGGRPGAVTLDVDDRRWTAYLFRADAARATRISLSKTGSGTAIVYVDGGAVPATTGDTVWDAGALSPGLHGVIVRAASGSFVLRRITMD